MTIADAQKPTEIRVGDTLYDVAGMSHPGGSIIKFYMGRNDATEAYREMHMRSKKADKMLKLLPNRPVPSAIMNSAECKRTRKFTTDFAALVTKLRAEGWYDPSPAHTVWRIFEIFAIHAVGLYLLLCTPWLITGLVILAVGEGRCGWYMHEGGHFSVTTDIKKDTLLQEFFYSFGCGMSAQWWRIQHNKHHAMPQKLDHDPDLDTLPFVAFNRLCYERAKKSPLAKIFIPIQAYIFAPISCCLIAMSWQYVIHPRHVFRRKLVREAFWMLLRHVVLFAMARYAEASVLQAVACYIIYDAFAGTYIFCNFAVSHTHLDVALPNQDVHWLEYASVHSMNCTPCLGTNWWMSYLNFQIEHHLFPSMPQYRFAKLWPQVKVLMETNGLKYDVRGYFESLAVTFQNLNEVSHQVAGKPAAAGQKRVF